MLPIAVSLILTLGLAAPFVPPYDAENLDGKYNYEAIGEPEEDLSETETGFSDKFWVDGVVSVTADSDGEQYLWVYATVHSPQLEDEDKLSIFGQISQVEQETDVEESRRRMLQDEEEESPLAIETPVSTFICTVKYDYQPTTIEKVQETSKWSIEDFTGTTILDMGVDDKTLLNE